MFGPMHRWMNVMTDMVTIIPTFMVELYIDARDAVLEVVPRFIRANECVLCPVARHGHQSECDKGKDERHQRSRPVDQAHQPAKNEEQEFATCGLHRQFIPFSTDQIRNQRPHSSE